MAKRDFNLKTGLIYSKDLIEQQNTEGLMNSIPKPRETEHLTTPSKATSENPILTKQEQGKKNKSITTTELRTQQTFRMSKAEYDFIKGLIVYQRMNGKPTFTRGDAIALWVEWIQEKYPVVQPYSEEL